jgi:hypothetical protein
MKEKEKARGGGMGLSGILGIVFIVLKLCGVINWNWVWVLAPFWIPLASGLLILIVTLTITAIGDKKDNERDSDS